MNLTEPKFIEIYQRQQESDLSVKDFCSNEGIKESTFYYWRKKLAGQGRIKNFIPLVVKDSAPQSLGGTEAHHRGQGRKKDASRGTCELYIGTSLEVRRYRGSGLYADIYRKSL